jgi:hypothetical protein
LGIVAPLSFSSILRHVSFVKEASEEDKVAEVHGNRETNVGWRDVALSVAGLLEESVGPNVDRTTDHHLDQLHCGDDHRNETGWIVFEGFQCVVRVHHGMNTIIHYNEPGFWVGKIGKVNKNQF